MDLTNVLWDKKLYKKLLKTPFKLENNALHLGKMLNLIKKYEKFNEKFLITFLPNDRFNNEKIEIEVETYPPLIRIEAMYLRHMFVEHKNNIKKYDYSITDFNIGIAYTSIQNFISILDYDASYRMYKIKIISICDTIEETIEERVNKKVEEALYEPGTGIAYQLAKSNFEELQK